MQADFDVYLRGTKKEKTDITLLINTGTLNVPKFPFK